ncbi:hypothetical protein BC835DRAFT_1311025 [Cytidiella melzeri]|nr:hypothetical protein BC835DRAFT_1311025 [Cytidiella melzeri]
MPPKRKHNELNGDFVDVPGQPNHLRCVPCSERSGKLHNITRTHMSDHIRTEKHVTAMAWKSQQNANETPIIPNTVGATASLSLPDIHPHRPYAPVARVRSESPSSVLQRMDTNKDGLFQDDCGQPIHFTAGEDEEQILNQALNQRIEDLNCYSHESLGNFWGSNTDTGSMFDNEDATLSNVVGALETMGKHLKVH